MDRKNQAAVDLEVGRRREKDILLPQSVYRHGARFRMRIYVGERKAPAWHYFKARDLPQFWEEWSRYLNKKHSVSMMDVFERYLGEVIPQKAADTQTSDRKALDYLRLAFGAMRPEDIKPHHIATYVDARGRKAAIRANREAALLSHVFTKCRHWGILEHNPAQQLRYRNPETPRTRYVTDRELWRAMRLAPPLIRHVMQFAVLTGLRRRDLLSLKFEQFTDDGLQVTLSKSRRKGSTPKTLLFTWSPSLAKVYHRAKHPGTDVFPLTEGAFDALWYRFQGRVVAAGIPRFQMKDLRAKRATDLEERGGDATKQLAHSSRSTTLRHYQRKPTRINLED